MEIRAAGATLMVGELTAGLAHLPSTTPVVLGEGGGPILRVDCSKWVVSIPAGRQGPDGIDILELLNTVIGAGTIGVARRAARELAEEYGLPVTAQPPRAPRSTGGRQRMNELAAGRNDDPTTLRDPSAGEGS